MDKVLVTGGAGFIGSNFVRFLLGKNKRVANLDALTYAGNLVSLEDVEGDKRYTFCKGNIGDAKLVRDLLFSWKPNAVVNFAAESHVDRSIDGSTAFLETNILGTVSLLEASLAYWKSLSEKKRSTFLFLHVSTDEVYGSLGASGVFSEESPYMPNSPYAASKASSDHFVRAFNRTYSFPAIITNCSNNYGPYQYPEKLIPLMIVNALKEKKLPVYGDGLNVRDWLYVEDHCEALFKVLCSGKSGERYNIGAGEERSNIQLVREICSILDELVPRENKKTYSDLIEFVADRPGHDFRYAVDTSKISSQLGWSPKKRFSTGILETVSWYVRNLRWVEHVLQNVYDMRRLGVKEG